MILLPESVSSCFSLLCSMVKKGGEGEQCGVVIDVDEGQGEAGNVLLFSNTWSSLLRLSGSL